VVFYRKDLPNYFLANSAGYAVVYDGQRYASAEHLFQALKFLPHRPDLAAKIRRARTADDAMRIARKHTEHIKRGWIVEALNIKSMHDALLLKFSQHSALESALLDTDDRELIYDHPSDVFWGAGQGCGRNMLGKALMDVRDLLRINNGVKYGSAAATM
jgi:ribA/ribD-fused uncharacterized protein